MKIELKKEILEHFQNNRLSFGDKLLEDDLKDRLHLSEEEVKIYEAVVLDELGFGRDFVLKSTNVDIKVTSLEQEDGTDVYIVLYSINGTYLRVIIENWI